ncbi:MAG: hypothetical protein ACLFU7_06790 [Armatimonadota bacterium]
MAEVTKLITGCAGVLIGLAAGFGILTLLMQRVGGSLFDIPALTVLAVAVILGGSAVLFGYIALWITGAVYEKREQARREAKKKRPFKK